VNVTHKKGQRGTRTWLDWGCTPINKETIFKVVFIGDQGVGKSSLVSRYVTSSFKTDYLPTIGANVVAKEYSYEGKVLTLIIWDIAGQDMFTKVRDKYYAGGSMAVLVYDVTKRDTLEHANFWLDDMKKATRSTIPVILVANKIDLDRIVRREEGEKLAKEIKAKLIETSAKTGENVRKLFEELVKILVQEYM
jgi:small GTP-binding protein